jgi:hypothetical protein
VDRLSYHRTLFSQVMITSGITIASPRGTTSECLHLQ